MFTIGICDDDGNVRDFIKGCADDYLGKIGAQYQIVLYKNGENLLAGLSEGNIQINLLFLDVEMPGKTGIEVKNSLEGNQFVEKIVFVTSHIETMQQAFGQRVVGFLDKPLSEKSVWNWIEKEFSDYNNKLEVPFGDKVYKANDILFIKTSGNYLIAKLVDGSESVLVRAGFSCITDRFGDKFIRVHKSYLINLNHIKDIKFNKIYVDNGEEIPLGRSYWDEVKNKYDDYVFAKVKRRMVW